VANRITTIFESETRSFKAGITQIKKDIGEAEGAVGKFKAGWKSAMTEFANSRAAQAVVAGIAVKLGKDAVQAASNLEESINAVNVVYGAQSEAVLQLGEDSVESYGMSQRAFNEFSTQFSAFAKQIADKDGRSVVDIVDEMATRVADFASVHNLSLEEAGRVAQSTLAGETEVFRRYGGDVSAATVKTFAYENGIADLGEELTESQKVLARYGAFMEQTADRAGDFANTSDELAGSSKKLTANLEDLQAQLGKHLIPTVTDAIGEINDLVVAIEGIEGALQGLNSMLPSPIGDRVSDYFNPGKIRSTLDTITKFGAPIRFLTDPAIEFGFRKLGGAIGSLGGNAGEVKDPLEGLNTELSSSRGHASRSQSAIDKLTLAQQMNAAAAAGMWDSGIDLNAALEEQANRLKEANKQQVAYENFVTDTNVAMEEQVARYEAAHESAATWLEGTQEAFEKAQTSISEFSEEAIEDIDKFQEELLTNIQASMDWQKNLNEIEAQTSPAFAAFMEGLGQDAAGLVADLAGNTEELEETFGIWGLSAGVMRGDVVSEFEKLSPEVKAVLESLGVDIDTVLINMATGVGDEAQGVGANVAAGIAAGIRGNVASLANEARAAVGAALSAARDQAGIRSPSKVFAEKVGEPIAEGIAEGVGAKTSDIADAVGVATTATTYQSGAFPISSPLSSLSSGLSGVSITVVQRDEPAIETVNRALKLARFL
jgi:hypothetical protein